jgi:hypothetical protein
MGDAAHDTFKGAAQFFGSNGISEEFALSRRQEVEVQFSSFVKVSG